MIEAAPHAAPSTLTTRRTRTTSTQAPISSRTRLAAPDAQMIPTIIDEDAPEGAYAATEAIAPRDQVVSLAAKGLSHQDIARATGLNLAEVELCLALAGITAQHVVTR